MRLPLPSGLNSTIAARSGGSPEVTLEADPMLTYIFVAFVGEYRNLESGRKHQLCSGRWRRHSRRVSRGGCRERRRKLVNSKRVVAKNGWSGSGFRCASK